MSKLIAVWGSPGSGKTSFASSLAYTISKDNHNVILVSTDDITPIVPVLLPIEDKIENLSIGKILQATDITDELVHKNSVTIKENEYLALIGYAQKENSTSYVKNSEEKSSDFILHISHKADYVIIDCSSDILRNKLSKVALQQAEIVFQIYTSEPRSQIFFSSYADMLDNDKYNYALFTRLLKYNSNKALNAVNEAKASIGNISAVLPYSIKLQQQYSAGTLLKESCGDTKYQNIISNIVKEHIYECE